MPKKPLGNLYLGCAGWTIPKMAADRFASEGSHLGRFAQTFWAVEINSCFYRSHQAKTYQRWSETVPGDFRFSAKVPKEVTHVCRLCDVEKQLARFVQEVSALGDKLGPLLVQLPPSLEFNSSAAGNFWEQFRGLFDGEVACEPRHASWFREEAERMLDDYRVARVAADPVLAPSAESPGGWQGLHYWRLHGSPRTYYSSYEPAYLAALAGRLTHAVDAGKQVWCIFDNTALGAATTNALDLAELLAKKSVAVSIGGSDHSTDIRTDSGGGA